MTGGANIVEDRVPITYEADSRPFMKRTYGFDERRGLFSDLYDSGFRLLLLNAQL